MLIMKFTLGVIVGAAAATLVVHYLNTREGKALVDKVKHDADCVSENLTGLADGIVQKGRSFLGTDNNTTQQGVVEETFVLVVPG